MSCARAHHYRPTSEGVLEASTQSLTGNKRNRGPVIRGAIHLALIPIVCPFECPERLSPSVLIDKGLILIKMSCLFGKAYWDSEVYLVVRNAQQKHHNKS